MMPLLPCAAVTTAAADWRSVCGGPICYRFAESCVFDLPATVAIGIQHTTGQAAADARLGLV